jgi:subtilisin family serine protease
VSRTRGAAAIAVVAALLGSVPVAIAANDPLERQQYALRTLRVQDGWARGRGAGVAVAVIDTGVDLVHEDLVAKLVPGHDFVDGDDRPSDVNGHGTHIAGIVAATTDNGAGVAGVAPDARIIPLRALNEKGTGVDTDVADAIDFAVAAAERENLQLVVNLSLTDLEVRGTVNSPRIERAIRKAWFAGAVIVAAAGNDALQLADYPAAGPNVVSVGAVDVRDRRVSFSNRRPMVVAPGHRIVSTFWDPLTPDDHAVYALGSGTSMAASFVSGVAAMLLSAGYTNAETVERIVDTSDDLGPPGRDSEFGFGRVNAARAIGVSTETKAVPGSSDDAPPRSAAERFEKLPATRPPDDLPQRGPLVSVASLAAALAIAGALLRRRIERG